MAVPPQDEILRLTNRKDLGEVGGGHNQKGVEFQRHWALMHMFQLEADGAKDFLMLFEAVQDIAVLDSETSPTSVCVYQVKKKDRKEWTWAELTDLHQPKDPNAAVVNARPKPLASVRSSPLGKLYAAVLAFRDLKSTGRFVSNARCDLPLSDGTSVATSLPCALSTLSADYLDLLSKALHALHAGGAPLPDLSRLHLEHTKVPADDPGTHLLGFVHQFLSERSPRHAGQARALLDSLLVTVARLGAKTDYCKTFDQLRTERGYSRSEFADALGQLQEIPDLLECLETWLVQLTHEGVGFREVTAIRVAASSIYRRQLMGNPSPDEERLIVACDTWIDARADPTHLKPYFDDAYNGLHEDYPSFSRPQLLAHLALRAVRRCVDPT